MIGTQVYKVGGDGKSNFL